MLLANFRASAAVAVLGLAGITGAHGQTPGPATPAPSTTPAPAPAVPNGTPLVVFPSGLDPQAERFAEDRYRFVQQKAVAEALKELCGTNYGPEKECGPASDPKSGAKTTGGNAGRQADKQTTKTAVTQATTSLPQLIETGLWGTVRSGTLVFPDGHPETVKASASPISGGYIVKAVQRSAIVLERDGKTITLPLEPRSAGVAHATIPDEPPASLPPLVPLAVAAPAKEAAPQPPAPKPQDSLFDFNSPFPPAPAKRPPGPTVTSPTLAEPPQ